jgi:hypothetical protein
MRVELPFGYPFAAVQFGDSLSDPGIDGQCSEELISGLRGFLVVQRTRINWDRPSQELHRENLLLFLWQCLERLQKLGSLLTHTFKLPRSLAPDKAQEGFKLKPMADSQIQYVSDETGQPVSVIVPIELWREIESERETAYLLRSAKMKERLLRAMGREEGSPQETWNSPLTPWPSLPQRPKKFTFEI